MMKCLSDKYPEVRQAAAYGFGVMGQIGGEEYFYTLARAIDPLGAMILRLDAMDSRECINATDNALVAVWKILKYSEKNINLQNVLSKESNDYLFYVEALRYEYIKNLNFAMKGPRRMKTSLYHINWWSVASAANVVPLSSSSLYSQRWDSVASFPLRSSIFPETILFAMNSVYHAINVPLRIFV
ncbi:hypothetical protein ANCCAN_00191 [Ancylostoma caninum]|uniref:HEAT repeat protein n=1 Tax=Ancylostoma caninum TaxID=29170 RepID=A0A368HEB6_ANCCA|nr:hypothetical protein ANCCAN_00191 [Ancylostoma caninum]